MTSDAAKNVETVEAYYRAFNAKDLATMSGYLHPEVHLSSPLSETHGREAVLEAAKGLMAIDANFNFRATFGSAEQVMLAYDLTCRPPIGLVRSAGLFGLKEGKIVRIELFLDARPFEKFAKPAVAQPST